MNDPLRDDVKALAPCPFCGSPAIVRHDPSQGPSPWGVCCTSCFAEVQWFSSEQRAIYLWNRRHAPAPDASRVEEVARMLFEMDTGNIGGGWGGENEYQQKHWREKAARICAISPAPSGDGGLREAVLLLRQAHDLPRGHSARSGLYRRAWEWIDAALSATSAPPSVVARNTSTACRRRSAYFCSKTPAPSMPMTRPVRSRIGS